MLTTLHMRPYLTTDRTVCIDLFESNVPDHFGEHERADFLASIDDAEVRYFVLEDERGTALGCGGYAPHPQAPAAGLVWGMIRREMHGRGLGAHLLARRLERIRAERRYASVLIETTPMSQGFFARFGFVIRRVEPDGFGGGYDLVEMELSL